MRVSRAVGLPDLLPDVYGLAVRVFLGGGRGDQHGSDYGDLLFATTGWGRFSRFVLVPARSSTTRPMTTLLPYRTRSGPILLGARASGELHFELAWATPRGDWHHFGDLRLADLPAPDQEVSFDPVRHRLPGLEQYPAVVRLREPAYLRARASRDPR